MSTRAVFFSFLGLIVLVAASVWAVTSRLGVTDRASVPMISRDFDARFAALEKRLEARLSALEAHLGAPPGAPEIALSSAGGDDAGADGEVGAAGESADGSASPEIRLVRLESRMNDLELRFRASGEDPVLRGHTYLESESERLRRQGINLLERFARSDPEARRAIRGMLSDPDAGVREDAVEALARARDQEAVPEILNLIGDPNVRVREEALDAVDDILEEGGDPAMVAAAVERVLPSLTDEASDVRETAAETAGDLRAREAVPDLLRLLGDQDEGVRRNAIEALGEIGDGAATPALRELYAKTEGWDRIRIARSLQQLGDGSAMAAESTRFREVALTSQDARARERAVEFLAENAVQANRDVLERALQDPNPRVRREAEQGMRRLRSGDREPGGAGPPRGGR